MSLGCPFELRCGSRRDEKTAMGVGRFSLMGGLLLIAILAHATGNGCKAAYDDGTRSADVARCEAAASAGGPNAEFEYGLLR
jgi:hypothetical protein